MTKQEPEYVETWKGISFTLGRSERWCRYMAARSNDPLPTHKMGGIVRLDRELSAWLGRQTKASSRSSHLSRLVEQYSGVCTKCDDRIPLRNDGAVKLHSVEHGKQMRECLGTGRLPKRGTSEAVAAAPAAPPSLSVPELTAVGQPVDIEAFERGVHKPHLVGTSAGCGCWDCWDSEMRRG